MRARSTYHAWIRAARSVAAAVFVIAAIPADDVVAQVISSPHGDVRIELKCADCHTSAGWSPIRTKPTFDHAEQTGFALLGMHETTACVSCHTELRFDRPQAVAEDCASCHVDVHQGAIAELCVDCHSTASFSDVNGLAVHARSLFPLEGAHASLTCETCHEDDLGGAFSPLPTECVDCHSDDVSAALMPDHSAPGFPTTCLDCHTQSLWMEAEFDHGAASEGFALLGAHEVLSCASCHVSGTNEPIFDAASDLDCIACHRADYDDQHAGSGFPTTCLDCHTTLTFEDAVLDHASASGGFELLGKHAEISCTGCHMEGSNETIFQPSSDLDCIACHRADYDDKHGGENTPTTCIDCHNTWDWDDADD